MLERTIAFLGMQACAIAMGWAVFADEVPDNYLPGTWAIGGTDACGTPASEHITFDPDGTFRTVRSEQPTATGFWHLVEDVLDLHMVSSPAFFDDPATRFDDALSDFAGQYQYFYAQGAAVRHRAGRLSRRGDHGQHAARRQLPPLPVKRPDVSATGAGTW
jgi:hypothetical protein